MHACPQHLFIFPLQFYWVVVPAHNGMQRLFTYLSINLKPAYFIFILNILLINADANLGIIPPATSLPALSLISSDDSPNPSYSQMNAPTFTTATAACNADTLTVASQWANSLQLAAGLLPNTSISSKTPGMVFANCYCSQNSGENSKRGICWPNRPPSRPASQSWHSYPP